MSIWGKLFGSDAVIERGVEGVYNGVDKLVYTPEEKADRFNTLMKVYEPFKLIQRFMVVAFCAPFVLFHSIIITSTILAMVGYGVDASDWAVISDMVNGAFGFPVSAAVTLYLTGGVLEGGINAFKKK